MYAQKKNTELYDSIINICKEGYLSPNIIYEKLNKELNISKIDLYNAIKQLKKHKILYQKGTGKGSKVSSYENNKIIFK